MTRWFEFISSFVCICSLVTACGGGESRPGPLKFHLDDMHIAQVPIEEQQEVFRAQTEFNKAKAERAKASADYEQSATDLDVAKNEAKQAILAENSAKSKKQAADKRGNMNEVNAISLELRAAQLARQAADKKVAYGKAQRAYLKRYLLFAEDQMYAKEARFELTKARLAQRKNIRPKGFAMADYEKQDESRARYAQRTRAKLDREKAKVAELKKEWKRLEKEAQTASGEVTGEGSDDDTATEAVDGGDGSLDDGSLDDGSLDDGSLDDGGDNSNSPAP